MSNAPQPAPVILDGAYRLLRAAGTGGTARVFQAEDTKTGQKVAVKVLRKELADQQDFVARFQREATLLRQLNHPNLVHFIRLEAAPEGLLLILDWVEGQRLDELVKQGKLSTPHALSVLGQVASALAGLHTAGIVHRDLKPENVMVDLGADPPTARLLDLGIARFADPKKAAKAFVTVQGSVTGTPTYLSPEQITDKPASPQSDIYSFGVMGYLLLQGRPPFKAANDFMMMQMHLHEPAPRLQPTDPALANSPVVDVLAQCLEKAPNKRPANGMELQALLERQPGAQPKKKWWPFGR